jgi:FdhD protein
LSGSISHRFTVVTRDGVRQAADRAIAGEKPVAIEYNGFGYAVLMATPTDLEDLAYGFTFAERLALERDDILDLDVQQIEAGFIVRVTLAPARAELIFDRVRHRVSESACGLCGVENLEQAVRPLPLVSQRSRADEAAIFKGLAGLAERQPLNRATGAVHAAALVDAAGAIRLVREDVGRHNAFDKLLGAMRRECLEWDGGFALLTSRCSYELVEKAVLADCPLLATISAPTRLAIERAEQAGLRLAVLARPDSVLLR